MSWELTILLYGFMALTGAVTGAFALVFLVSRSRPSRILGVISIACVTAALLLFMAYRGQPPKSLDWGVFCVSLMPGLLGIVFNRAPRSAPGHCTKCGYNLTGNVSGKCSECGAPVPAS